VALSFLILASGPGASPQSADPPEVQVHGTTPKFRIRAERNLVIVRLVVRDAKDRTVGDLHKKDFLLFDDGKPQEITGFSVEAANLRTAVTEARSTPATATGTPTPTLPPPAPAAPQRFVALFFDDLHIEGEGIGRTRDAAWRYLSTTVQPQGRVAILTSSGENQLNFTDDHAKLHETLSRLGNRSRPSEPGRYPDIGDYQAYLIDQVHDRDATEIAYAEATQRLCCEAGDSEANPPTSGTPHAGEAVFAGHCDLAAQRWALDQAADIWSAAKIQSENSLQKIRGAVARLAAMPGQRSLVLVSSGFLTETHEDEMDAIINRALRQGVVINALDAAGPYTPVPHRLMTPSRPDLGAQKTVLEHMAVTDAREVLASLTAGTGGVFFHDSDDFDDGFRQAAAVPEVSYVLSFSPQNVKLNGKFHSLKVTLNTHEPFTVQARRGYFASDTALAEQAPSTDELHQVVFSLEERHELPAEVSTKVEKLNDQKSTLTVSIHVDIASLRYRKEADRSVNTLIFDTALFDHDGKHLSGKEGSLELHLKDGSLEKFSKSGINAKTSFEVVPGTYRVREVVRDSESTGMSALNCEVQVPVAPQ
jgi:VWFA-related protein